MSAYNLSGMLVSVLLLLFAFGSGTGLGFYFTRRSMAMQATTIRAEALRTREDDRISQQRVNDGITDLLRAGHREVFTTMREADAQAAEARERVDAETMRVHVGAIELLKASHQNLFATIKTASIEAARAHENTYADAARAHDEATTTLTASHEILLLTVRKAGIDAATAHEKTHQEALRAHDEATVTLTTSHETLLATVRKAGVDAATAHEKTHQETLRAHDEATVHLTTSHETLLATVRKAGANAAIAHEETHQETLRAHQDGALILLESVREQLAHGDVERLTLSKARELAERELTTVTSRLSTALAQMAELRDQFQADRTTIEERIRELVQAATTKALIEANAVLIDQSSRQFIAQRTETMRSVEIATQPLTVGIQKFQQIVIEFDKSREAGVESLKATLETMARSDDTLRQTVERSTTETAKLSTALRDNRVRGRWGEIGLRNVLEKVGLTDFCDFVEQAGNEDGNRPDVVIKLPGDREVAVDSKVPLEAYMNALEATDPVEQQRLLLANADALRHKVRNLASRGYHRTSKAIGVTILYVQIESVVAAALSIHPTLVEEAIDLGIVIATPATLLAYVRAFSREWSLYKQSQNALQIVQLAHEMLDRLVTFAERFAVVGARLDDSVKAWNTSVGSFDSRLVVTAKQIADLSATTFTVSRPPVMIETLPREVQKINDLRALAASIVSQDIANTQGALPA